MIGKGSEKTDVVYTDVPADHWGYDYIMYSGLDVFGHAVYARQGDYAR
ncbi:MAG: hypothetical protein L6V93_14195 [Clostridiales bacterium]|nr:MAG: hypothetical protein L6V93_14195 [Clostridiales bacterium]